MDAVTIPVMAKVRIGHFAEAQVLQALGVDYIDESEVLTPADDKYHCDKHAFTTPFVCGARDLGEALRRIAEGAAMIRSKGEAGSGNIVEAVRHMRAITRRDSRADASCRKKNWSRARAISARRSNSCAKSPRTGKLPVVLFCAGGVSTPADAALMMQLGAEGIFVGSGIFKSNEPDARSPKRSSTRRRTSTIPTVVVDAQPLARRVAKRWPGLDVRTLDQTQLLATRGN